LGFEGPADLFLKRASKNIIRLWILGEYGMGVRSICVDSYGTDDHLDQKSMTLLRCTTNLY